MTDLKSFLMGVFVFICTIVSCAVGEKEDTKTKKEHISFNKTYRNASLYHVIDSVKQTGTIVGQIDSATYKTDEDVRIKFIYSTLYRNGRAVGSIMAIPVKNDTTYYISIIDVIEIPISVDSIDIEL